MTPLHRLTCSLAGCLLFIFPVWAQDAYHATLNSTLQSNFELPPVAQWLLPDTEQTTLAGSTNYGGQTIAFDVSGQPFTKGIRRIVQQGANPWDAAHVYLNTTAVQKSDQCLLVVWLRSDSAQALVNILVEKTQTFEKEVYSAVPAVKTWRQYLVPFEADRDYAVGSMQLGLHLATRNQNIEIGGMACINYKKTVSAQQLPIQLYSDGYPGSEPDAAWRKAAATRIDSLRKANLNVVVLGSDSLPVLGAQVRVAMQRHDFKFGTAVVSNRFNGGTAFDPVYEEKLTNLDGRGHGFNEVVFENDLKWPAWEEGWFSSKQEIVSDVKWLRNKGISIRGHNLVWPGWTYSPTDITAGTAPLSMLNRINEHLNAILTYPGIKGELIDWDVLNEITTNTDYADKLAGTPGYPTGRELYTDIFKLAKQLEPKAKLYLNDFVAIEQGNLSDTNMKKWKTRIDELRLAGAPVEGIGFQGHFASPLTGIERIQEIYDDFWTTYKLEAKVTEYDISSLIPAQTQADYLRDVLTITFAHPSMKGFLMWGFWDGAHWLNNAPIYNTNWTLKPSGRTFIDLVFGEWWTDETQTTTGNGRLSYRPFKGTYKVEVVYPNGDFIQRELPILSDTMLVFRQPKTVGTRQAAQANFGLQCVYQPLDSHISVRWQVEQTGSKTNLQVHGVDGKPVYQETIEKGRKSTTIPAGQLPTGMHWVSLLQDGQVETQAVQIVR